MARITAENLGGARSVSSVLHHRLKGLGLDPVHDATWEQRTPAGASQLSRDLARGLDDRTRELGVRATEQVEPWLARRLGVLDPKASPAMRAEYERRAGVAAAYREAAGITDPDTDIARDPHAGNPELETWRKAAMRALEIRDEAEDLGNYYLYHAIRADLLRRLGRRAEAAAGYQAAIDRSQNEAECEFLTRSQARLQPPVP
jgi:hypothetical protein